MKTGYQASVDSELIPQFLEATRKNGHDKNRIIEDLMRGYIKKYGTIEYNVQPTKNLPKSILCPCGAEYSETFNACLSCGKSKSEGKVIG